METPDNVLEVFLQPGEFYFGDHLTRVRTILGSCISITFWHPTFKVGAMSHILLPYRPLNGLSSNLKLDGKYADEALELVVREIKNLGTRNQEYKVKIFGGGEMFSEVNPSKRLPIGLRNIEAGRQLLSKHGFKCDVEHLGGSGHRYIIFDIWSGDVWVKYKHHDFTNSIFV